MLICRVTGWKPFCFHNPLFPAFFAYCLLALFVLIITLFTTFSVTIGDIFIAFPEICYKYGFESLPHFSNFCKKNFGASPRSLRAGNLSEVNGMS